MGFLCAASLRPGRVPPTKIVGPRFEKSCLSRLLRYVDDDQGHWQSEFSRLAEGEQRALTPLILDIAIMQKCRGHDYEAMSEILSLACEYRIANSPMCRQAAELLKRIANCSTAIRLSRGAVTRDGVPPITTTLLQAQADFKRAGRRTRLSALHSMMFDVRAAVVTGAHASGSRTQSPSR